MNRDLTYENNLATSPSMNTLTREEVAKIKSLSVAKAELAQYADLLRVQNAIQKKLEERIKQLSAQVESGKQTEFLTQEQLAAMKRTIFGDKSERRQDENAGPLFDPSAAAPETETVTRKKRKTFGRRPQPLLPTVEIVHEMPEEEVKTEGLEKWEGQFEESELINVVPTKIVREIHKRQKYRATKERGIELPPIVTAPFPDTPIKIHSGDRYSLEFDIEVALGKYLWHLPLDRQVRMMESQGLKIDTQTLFSRTDTLAWYLETALLPKLAAEVMAAPVKFGDETTWKNLSKKPEPESGEKKKRFYLWAVRGGRAVCFSVYDGRSGKVAKAFLKDIEGVLIVDGYAGYNGLAGPKLIIARDWVHARRKFITAEQNNQKESRWFVAQMKLLFDIEDELKGKELSEIKRTREEKSKPILESIRFKREELQPKTLPQSALGKALAYLETYWAGLTVFLEHAEVPLHTNSIESAIRGPVVGRKNHAGSKSVKTGKVAAVFYSIVETCKANNVDVKRYLMDTMQRVLTKKEILLPWEFVDPVTAKAEEAVSETVVNETAPGLTTKPPEISPIPESKAIS